MSDTIRPKKPTVQTIADALGVHRSTVARALKPEERHRITAEVINRVMAEAERQGYRRDVTAASLRTGQSRLIGVVLTDLANPVFSSILDGISAELAGRSYSMLVAPVGTGADKQIEIVDALIGRRVDGMILATATRHDPTVGCCLRLKVPTVLVNRAEDELRAPSAVPDDYLGMQLAIDHLTANGHRRIAHIAGPQDVSTGLSRRLGFEGAMRAHGLDATWIVLAESIGRADGAAAARQICERWPDVTAICASNDMLALGALEYMRKAEIVCPDDVSITGFSDMPFIDLVDPALTTIRVPQRDMGKAAAQMLLEVIATPDTPPQLLRLPVSLIERGSVCPAPV